MEIRFGFIRNEIELKALILYILKHIVHPVPMNELTDVTLLCDGGISYFDFSECLSDLEKTGHVTSKDDRWSITEKGLENGGAVEDTIPYSVRIRAERAAAGVRQLLERDAMISATHELRQRGGMTVKLSLSDGVGKLIDLELLCGDETQAEKIESNFRKSAENIYGQLVELLLGEKI